MCLRGASEVANKVFRVTSDKNLVGFAAWVPVLGGKAASVKKAIKKAADPRMRHYWDAKGQLAKSFRGPLALQGPAWDVYLIYPPGVRWKGSVPPSPTFWMHQLSRDPSAPKSKRFNAAAFHKRLLVVLAGNAGRPGRSTKSIRSTR